MERDEWRRATRRGVWSRRGWTLKRFLIVDEMRAIISLSVLGAWVASWKAGVVLGAAQPRGKRTPPCLPA
jgi:hypothetical protein